MKKINIAELLKDCPKGMELDCTMFENVTFVRVDMGRKQFPIEIAVSGLRSKYLTKEGCFHDTTLLPEAKCVIFPKGKTTWEGFQRPFKDGDILYIQAASPWICIYKEGGEKENVYYKYAAITSSSLVYDCSPLCRRNNVEEIRHATEEEKIKLFQAIKDSGYKWNSETKTSEKLIEPKFKVGDRIKRIKTDNIYEIIKILSNCYIANYLGSDITILFDRQDNYELVPNKFDIAALKPFDKVLVRGDVGQKWTHDFFGFMDEDKGYPFVCVGHYVIQCIPYEGNEHLLGTTDDCIDYFKTWK